MRLFKGYMMWLMMRRTWKKDKHRVLKHDNDTMPRRPLWGGGVILVVEILIVVGHYVGVRVDWMHARGAMGWGRI